MSIECGVDGAPRSALRTRFLMQDDELDLYRPLRRRNRRRKAR
jgi:hypothetical protein